MTDSNDDEEMRRHEEHLKRTLDAFTQELNAGLGALLEGMFIKIATLHGDQLATQDGNKLLRDEMRAWDGYLKSYLDSFLGRIQKGQLHELEKDATAHANRMLEARRQAFDLLLTPTSSSTPATSPATSPSPPPEP